MLDVRRVILVLTIILLQFPNYSLAENSTGNINQREKFSQLERDIEAVLKNYNLTGFQLALNNTDGTLWNMNFGLSSRLLNTNVDDDTLFRIGSISKTVTAVAVMQLVERGVISLDTPIQAIIPEVHINNTWQEEAPITVLHLLEHTAGFDDNHFKEFVVSVNSMSTKEALDYHPHTRVARYKPGQFMSYANVDPTLLAYMIEKLSGLSFEAYVKQNIFKPLGMIRSSYFLGDTIKEHLATGHLKANNKIIATEYEFIKDRASGAINSNVTEMSKFQQMLINKGVYQKIRILNQNSIERMAITESTLAAKAGFQEGYSKYLITQRAAEDKWLGHSGEMIGFLSAMWQSTTRDVGYIFFTNTSSGNSYDADREINNILRRFIVDNYPSAVIENDENKVPSKNIESSNFYNLEIIGEYRLYTSRIELLGFIDGLESFSSVYVENGIVKLRTLNSTYTLTAVGHNVFKSKLVNGDEIRVVFIEDNGEWYYQIPSIYINAIQTSSLTKIASYAVVVSFLVMAIAIWGILVTRLILKLLRRKLNKAASVGWLSVANLSLFLCFIFLGSAGNSGMPLNILGQPSIQSVGVSVSLLMFFVFTFTSIAKFLTFHKTGSPIKKSKPLECTIAYAIFSNVIMLATLFYFDFLFVMLWLY
jgi:CubicO group peptidase (beta-lactamase class C family)